jgi:hypothetical protein
MNLYPNFYDLNKYFIDNFIDYNKFLNELQDITFSDTLEIYDVKHNEQKPTFLNNNYNSKIYLHIDNYIVDTYLNIYDFDKNQLYIQNYINFPPYILYLIKDKIITKPDQKIINYAKILLDLTKYIIFNYNNDNEDINDDDIEDFIYLKNKIGEYKYEIDELNKLIINKDTLINNYFLKINELKLKNRKCNFTLMENQNLFAELHAELCEKEIQIEEIIKEKDNQIKDKDDIIKQKDDIIKQKEYLESKLIFKVYKYLSDIYDGFYILISRIHF